MDRIAIFASGSGSNAEKIMEYFAGHPDAEVALVLSNRKQAGVLEKAEKFGVKTHIIQKQEFYETAGVLSVLDAEGINFIVLAGFLLLVPAYLVEAFPDRIVNIHPALLPKFGGKGMYGMNVHRAVKEAGETETGMTIHLVNEQYDKGRIVFQASCPVFAEDTPEEIAARVLALEHRFFPEIIERTLAELRFNLLH